MYNAQIHSMFLSLQKLGLELISIKNSDEGWDISTRGIGHHLHNPRALYRARLRAVLAFRAIVGEKTRKNSFNESIKPCMEQKKGGKDRVCAIA